VYSLIGSKMPIVGDDPGSASFARMLDASHARAQECLAESVAYSQQRWDARHAPAPFAVGDLVMISTKHFNFGGPSKLIPPWVGPFGVLAKVGPNAIRVDLTGDYRRKHPVFPVSLAKLHVAGDPKKFPGRRQAPPPEPEIHDGDAHWEVEAIVDQKRGKSKTKGSPPVTLYLVKWVGFDDTYNSWLPEAELGNARKALRDFRASRRGVLTEDGQPS